MTVECDEPAYVLLIPTNRHGWSRAVAVSFGHGPREEPARGGAMKRTRSWLAAGLLALCAIAGATQRSAFAQNYSARPVKLVVPYPPAGTADIVARLLAEQIGRTGGPSIVIENRPGGGTAIASEAVSRAVPDGSTLLMISPEFVITPHLRKPNYDPLTSFEPICQLVNSPTVIV